MTNNNQNQGQKMAPSDRAEESGAKRENESPQRGERETADKMRAEMKKAWNKLTDEDVVLYEKQPEQFFTKVKEKHGASREEAQKRLTEIKAACGSCGTDKAA
jgi:uncharacterized protein YjbJ (UPF0337 family)